LFLPTAQGPTLKLAIYRTSSIGDVVLATALLDYLSKLKVDLHIYWLGRSPSVDLILESFPQIKVIRIPPGNQMNTPEIIGQLSEVHFFIDLQTNFRSRLLARAFRKAFRRPVYSADKQGLQRSRLIAEAMVFGRRRSLSKKAKTPQIFQFEMMLQPLIDALTRQLPPDALDDMKAYQAHPFLATNHDMGQKPWQKELRFGAWIGVAPGAAHLTKKAPDEVFLGILQKVSEYRRHSQIDHSAPLGIAFFGNQEDRKFSLRIIDRLGWEGPCLNLAGLLSLWETTLGLKHLTVLLSNDSSLGHIAEAVNTPTAILFGPTVEGFGFAPRMEESRAFSMELGCRPCSKHGKSPCRYRDQLCFTGLPQDDIALFLLEKISNTANLDSPTDGPENNNPHATTGQT
jgi:ADP-heptose:LPS heptosyltransferase